MQCRSAKSKNAGNRKFCRDCGAKLVLALAKVSVREPSFDKFCGDCGYDLTQPSPAVPKKALL